MPTVPVRGLVPLRTEIAVQRDAVSADSGAHFSPGIERGSATLVAYDLDRDLVVEIAGDFTPKTRKERRPIDAEHELAHALEPVFAAHPLELDV